MDLILGPWFDQATLTGEELSMLESLLEESDTQLFLWFTKKSSIPQGGYHTLILKIIAHAYAPKCF